MSFDFFDEEGFDEMITEQKKATSEAKKYIPNTKAWTEGDYIFRIYPELYNGKPRMRRTVWTHQLHDYKMVLSPKDDNRINDLIWDAKERGYNPMTTLFWKNRSNKETIMMVELYSGPESKYIHEGTTALILNDLQVQGLDSFLESIENEGISLRSFLNPNKPNYAIKMNISKVAKAGSKKKTTKINFSNTMKSNYELNPSIEAGLPDGVKFEGLDNVYVREDSALTEEQFASFKEYYDAKLLEIDKAAASHNEDPNASSANAGYEVNFDDEEDSEKKHNLAN